MSVNTSVTQIKCSYKRFFYLWLQFTSPLHKLNNKDMMILACILKKRHELSKIITDDAMVDKFLFSRDVREQVMDENNIKRAAFQQTLSELRKAGIIDDDRLNKKIVPPLDNKNKRFDFMVTFNIEADLAKQEAKENLIDDVDGTKCKDSKDN